MLQMQIGNRFVSTYSVTPLLPNYPPFTLHIFHLSWAGRGGAGLGQAR